MFKTGRCSALALICLMHLNAQAPDSAEKPVAMGPGVTPPQVVKKIDPAYSRQAEKDHLQGTVVLRLVVTAKGLPADITVLSPLGRGLDEEAIAAVKRWKFTPGKKNGQPVAVRATIEVNFRLLNIPFDQKSENERTRFNTAAQTLRQAPAESPAAQRALKDVQSLADQEFAPTMYLIGVWETMGYGVPKDLTLGLTLIQKAADKHYVQAMYNLATREIDGRDVPADPKAGMDLMHQAANAGSTDAQYYLGDRYQIGKGVVAEPDRASRYFRLCAAQGNARCQYRLATMLMDTPDAKERDRVQAIAWFQLAGVTIPEAREIGAREAEKLTPDENRSLASLKDHLVHK